MIRNVEISRPIPAEAQKPCAEPVTPPDRRLTEREVKSWWNKDRFALRECEARRKLAVGE